jgi:outer membrane biosynthesis protein TonB
MRIGSSIVSLTLHAALAWGGITVAPALIQTSEPVPMFDIELVTIADVTNLRPQAAEEVAEEVKPEEPPPAPEPEEVIIPEEAAPPPPPKEEPKPEPKKEKEPDFDDELKKLLAAANSAPAPAKKEETSANPFKNPNRARAGVGTGDAAMVTIEQYIMRQILDNGCWSKQTGLADAQTMSATIRVRFGRDGRFSEEPKLIEPSRMPAGGPFLVYVTRAFSGLNKCNTRGFKVPDEYFSVMKSPTIDLRFQPGAD